MEKVLYLLAAQDRDAVDDLGARLRGEAAATLGELGARGVQVNVADRDVAAAEGLRITTSDQPADAVVSVWVDSAIDHLRRPVDDALGAAATVVGAYLVTESVPMPNTAAVAPPGGRTDGFAQLAFLRRPADLAVSDWLDRWHNHHTQLAIDVQDTFGYVQNVVVRPLRDGSPPWDAIVEECFPAAAMSDPHVFFDAVGDDERLARHQQAMFDSVQRFIDLSAIDVVPTSRYVISPPTGPAG